MAIGVTLWRYPIWPSALSIAFFVRGCAPKAVKLASSNFKATCHEFSGGYSTKYREHGIWRAKQTSEPPVLSALSRRGRGRAPAGDARDNASTARPQRSFRRLTQKHRKTSLLSVRMLNLWCWARIYWGSTLALARMLRDRRPDASLSALCGQNSQTPSGRRAGRAAQLCCAVLPRLLRERAPSVKQAVLPPNAAVLSNDGAYDRCLRFLAKRAYCSLLCLAGADEAHL